MILNPDIDYFLYVKQVEPNIEAFILTVIC
jgi:hypothetical protein